MTKAKPISELYAEFTPEELEEIEKDQQIFITELRDLHKQNSDLDVEEIEAMVEKELRKYRKSLLNR